MKIVPKVWGEERWIVNKDYCGKILILKKGHQCSLHFHRQKDETFYVSKGIVKLEYGKKTRIMYPGDSQYIPHRKVHRFTGVEDSEIIEFSTHHDDGDSYRLEESK